MSNFKPVGLSAQHYAGSLKNKTVVAQPGLSATHGLNPAENWQVVFDWPVKKGQPRQISIKNLAGQVRRVSAEPFLIEPSSFLDFARLLVNKQFEKSKSLKPALFPSAKCGDAMDWLEHLWSMPAFNRVPRPVPHHLIKSVKTLNHCLNLPDKPIPLTRRQKKLRKLSELKKDLEHLFKYRSTNWHWTQRAFPRADRKWLSDLIKRNFSE